MYERSDYDIMAEIANIQSEDLLRKDAEIALLREKVRLLERKVDLLEGEQNGNSKTGRTA